MYLATHLIRNPFCLKTEPISIFMEHGSHKDALKVKGRPLISPKPRKYLYANRICLKREAFAHLWRSTRDFHNARGDCGKGMAFGTSCRLIPFGHWPGCLRFSDSPIPEDFWMANVEGADFVVKVESPSRQFGRQAICVFVDLCSDSGFLGAHLQRHLYPYSPPGAPYILHWPWAVQLHYSKLENPFPATEHHPTHSVI